jgi:hypothetical protein
MPNGHYYFDFFDVNHLINIPEVTLDTKIPETSDFMQWACITRKGPPGDIISGKNDEEIKVGEIYAKLGYDLVQAINRDAIFFQRVLNQLSIQGKGSLGLLVQQAEKFAESQEHVEADQEQCKPALETYDRIPCARACCQMLEAAAATPQTTDPMEETPPEPLPVESAPVEEPHEGAAPPLAPITGNQSLPIHPLSNNVVN